MKYFCTLAFLLVLISCGGNNSTPTPAAPLEVVKTAVGTAIGTPVTQTLGAAGGNVSVVSAGAKIIVPAGAMLNGSSLSVQAISNTLVGTGEGIQISGDAWSKPVTMQFSYPASETDPNNLRVAIQQNDGSWITSKSAKVDAINRTVSVRLGPDSSATTGAAIAKSNLQAKAKLDRRHIVMTKALYLKPKTVTVKLGATVSFTAYASLAITEAIPSSQATTDDDELVPLVQPAVSSKKPIDDEELTPIAKLRVVVREYPFTNSKAGFTRFWAVDGPGTIDASTGVYTAPTDPGARGKTAKVFFTSADAKGVVVISGSVKIEGGPKAYQVAYTNGNGTTSGTICDRSKPFSLLLTITGYTQGDWNFTPSNDTTGSVSFTLSYLGVVTAFSGTYSFADSVDGTADTLSVTGTQTVTAPNGAQVQKPLDDTFPLTPIAACAPQ